MTVLAPTTRKRATNHKFAVPTVTCTITNGCKCAPRTTRNLCSTTPTTRVGRGGFVTA